MSEAKKDVQRASAAVKAILDGRDPQVDANSIMVTLEHAISAALLVMYPNPDFAALMLNEALLQGTEARLSRYKSGK